MSDLPPDALPEWSDEERALWNSALGDRPPRRSLGATLRAVGVGGAVIAAASGAEAAVAAKAGIGLALVKWGAAVGLAGAVVVGGGLIGQRLARLDKPQLVVVSAKHEAPRRATPHVEQAQPTPANTETAPLSELAATVPAPPARPSTAAARASSSGPSQPDIAGEIENIDAARELLRQGHSKEALSTLNHYRTEHGKSKSLGVEATVLRIEALLGQGEKTRASALANAFLAAHPKSPYASRIRGLLRNSADR
jgi:hypothetical protein